MELTPRSASGDDGLITTFTGQTFSPLDPQPGTIHLTDIAHALSMQCRWTGHTPFHYSVAQHSMYVCRYLEDNGCPLHVCFAGLLHDASEAYLSDVSRPVKHSTFMQGYRIIEHNLEEAIEKTFNIHLTEHERGSIKHADHFMLSYEGEYLMKVRIPREPSIVPSFKIGSWGPGRAERVFLSMAKKYMKVLG